MNQNKEIYEVRRPVNIPENACAVTSVVGSKSITNRALLLAAMADGTSALNGCLTSDDARCFIECLKALGFSVIERSDGNLGSNITITGLGGAVPRKNAEIYVGSAGTAARFLVAMLAFSDGEYVVNSSYQMKKRPMQPLIDALRNAGAEVSCLEDDGHFPLRITGARACGSDIIPNSFSVNIDKSSQFLSALLIAVGTLGKKAEINVTGSHGLSYVDLTAEMMKDFGVTVHKQTSEGGSVKYLFSGGDNYAPLDYSIEPDMSAAAYFYALAAVLGTSVTVRGVSENMLQGDIEFLRVLEKIGCKICAGNGDTAVTGPKNGELKGGFTVDMSAFSDQALTLAAIAPFADAPITITGIGHIRLQECDRISAIAENLAALGIKTDENPDSITIYPGRPHACNIKTYDDHRVAMSFALTGLRTDGVKILDPYCCKKTFAEYFDVLEDVLSQLSE